MEIKNGTENNKKTVSLFVKYLLFKVYIYSYILAILFLISILNRILYKIPGEETYLKTMVTVVGLASIVLSAIVSPIILSYVLKRRYSNDSIYDYVFFETHFECRKTDNDFSHHIKMNYSDIIQVIETQELYIFRTKVAKNHYIIIDKWGFIDNEGNVLIKFLKSLSIKYQLVIV